MISQNPLRIAFLISHHVNLLDLCSPMQTFNTINQLPQHGGAFYESVLVSVEGGLITTSCGQKLMTSPVAVLDDSPLDTLIIAGGCADIEMSQPAQLVSEITRLAASARRICALSTGTFLLAATGLLAGRTVSVHWSWSHLLQQLYPDMKIDSDKIFIQDGSIWTSAGMTAGFDLALALVEEDSGHALSMEAARKLVMFIKRPGAQSQVSVSLAVQCSADSQFADLHSWMASNLCEDLRVSRLAEQVCMSPRTFARTYAQRVGRTPAKTIEAMRLEAACRALENTRTPIKRIAEKIGMISEQNMQRAFRRAFGISPRQYRSQL